jgi:hypothetical protein
LSVRAVVDADGQETGMFEVPAGGGAIAPDRRAQFIGLDAFEQAGGAIMRDLFEHDDGGWLQDVPLLDRLVTEKLKVEAETIAAEGWKWIAVAVNFPIATPATSAS